MYGHSDYLSTSELPPRSLGADWVHRVCARRGIRIRGDTSPWPCGPLVLEGTGREGQGEASVPPDPLAWAHDGTARVFLSRLPSTSRAVGTVSSSPSVGGRFFVNTLLHCLSPSSHLPFSAVSLKTSSLVDECHPVLV